MHHQKTIYFISGLPRSGSNLLCNILNQNPRFFAENNSGAFEILLRIRNSWDNMIEFKASPNLGAKIRVIKGALHDYHSEKKEPVIFDECGSWLAHIEMLEEILSQKIKVIVPVRDIREILASYEKIWRRSSRTSQTDQESKNYIKFQSVKDRCDFWLKNDQPLGIAYNRVNDAILRGHGDSMHMVDFGDLTADPANTLKGIYEFLGEKEYKHDFQRVQQTTKLDNLKDGFQNCYLIRPNIQPNPLEWETILGKFVEPFGSMNFWRSENLKKDIEI